MKMTIQTYTIYLKSGNISVVVADSSLRKDKFTELYKTDKYGHKHVVARFENDGLEGIVITTKEWDKKALFGGKLMTNEEAKALEQIDKIKNILKDGVRQITRDSFNEDFEDFSIGDIKDEMWELYEMLYKIDCVLKDKSESVE